MKLDQFLDKKITVTQVKSGLKLNDRQRGNIIGLGLRGIGTSRTLIGSAAVLGMVKKLHTIVKISLS